MEQGEMSDNERIHIKRQQNTYQRANETTSVENKSDNERIHVKMQQKTYKGANENTSVDNKSDSKRVHVKTQQSTYKGASKTTSVDNKTMYQWGSLQGSKHDRTVERQTRKIRSLDANWEESDIGRKRLKIQQSMYNTVKSDSYRPHVQTQQSIYKEANEFTAVDNKTRQKIKRNQVEDTENNTKLRKSVDDTLSELLVDQFSAVMKSVGCLMSQYGKGTIFRVGSKYGMTAAHVVVAIINPHGQERGDCSRLCRNQVYVSFSESGPKFKLAGKVLFLDFSLDVAIVEFRDEIIQDLPPALSMLTNSAFPSDVAVIGYGHGNNESKCLEHSVKVIDPESVPVDEIRTYLIPRQQLFKPVLKCLGKDSGCVDVGYTGYKDSHRILLNAYLGKGASGSPIFTKADPSTLQIVGIFTCGYPKLAYELPATIKFPNKYTFEAGTKMDFIYNALKRENQELAEDIFNIK